MAVKVANYTQTLEMEIQQRMEELKAAEAQIVHTGRLSSLGEMAAGIAHEINQPLNIIRLKSQSLIFNAEKGLTPPLTNDVAEAIKLIDSQVDRISRIITHLRAFARKESITDIKPTDINQPMEDVFLLIGESLRLRGITVQKSLSPTPLMVTGSANRLEQVFLNLITNARDAMERLPEKAEKMLTVSSRPNDDGKIEIRISDTGGEYQLR